MKYVDRTATVYDDREESSGQLSRPLAEYRSEWAYVLLGDPGAGKTTAFRHEAKATGARYATAREFLRGDLDGALDGESAALFIDGLDEARAGGGDPRSPLDKIVARLRKLTCPRFRLSCRPADWGQTDTDALQSVLNDKRIAVLRLDPLGRSGIRDALDGLPAAAEMNTDDFVRQAVDRGLGGLLDNPQSLQLLSSVVAKGNWPTSRTELFEQACRQLLREQNPQHVDAGQRRDATELDTEALLDAAGQLSALFLLTNAQAICKSGVEKRNAELALEDVGAGSREAASRVIATKLFTAESPQRFVPVHMHIAEYLGARFLSNVIKGGTSGQRIGLPSTRVLALMTGHDGGIVSGLRGLAAWLATLCGEARNAVVDADPIGVLAYGDAGRFDEDNLANLIRSLEGKARQLSRRAWSAPALGSIVQQGTIRMLRAHIAYGARSDARQAVVDLLLRGIPHADLMRWVGPEHSSSVYQSFIARLLHLVRDRTWWQRVRFAGLKAALHIVERSGEGDELVDELLRELNAGRVHDPDNELRGILLTALYPGRISPEQIWDYVPKTANQSLFGHDLMFWSKRIEQQTDFADLPVLLEGLHGSSSQLLAVLRENEIADLVTRLLLRVLDEYGEEAPTSRLSMWIEIAARTSPLHAGRRIRTNRQHLRSWYAARPAICKACLLDFLKRNARKERLDPDAWRYRREVFGDSAPPDLAAWCLDHAIELAASHAPVARILLEWAVPLQRTERHFDRWVASAAARVQDLPDLRDRLTELARPLEPELDEATPIRPEWGRQAAAVRERRCQEEQQFVAHVRERAGKLAAGSCEPALLGCLARTYFGFDAGHMSTSPVDALRSSLGSDEGLVSAALSGFRQLLERDDLPDLDGIIRLDKDGKRSWFALPFLAGLAEGDRTGCGGYRTLTADGIKRAVGFYYVSPRPTVRHSRSGWHFLAGIPAWYDELVQSRAELVAESLVAVHLSMIRRKVQCETYLAPLAQDPKYRQLARLAAPSLFRAFPVRCTRPQILALRHLLWASVQYMPDELASWVATKLARSGMDVAQRALWLGAGMLVSPDRYLAAAMEFVRGGSPVRVQHLVGFVVPDALPLYKMEWTAEHLAMAVRGIGARIEPWRPPGGETKARLMTPADDAANKARRLLSTWLNGLAEDPGTKATDALASLAVAPELAPWRHDILEARDQQTVLRRAHLHRIPTASEVQGVLQNAEPANAADLLALTVDRLEELARNIRDGNTNDWRQYWNVDSYGRPEEPRPESTCRDALLSALRSLPTGVGVNVDAQPEAHYAEAKRADIRVAYGGHAIPVEIKKNTHLRLWSAINDQLINQYARAPESGGFGVYLVLWFGVRRTRIVPPTGRLPKTPEALQERLSAQLPPDKQHKIKVVVVDVSEPSSWT